MANRVKRSVHLDGGWIFTKDAKGRPWMTVACQGLGASVWYPCKDHQSDEPDEGADLFITACFHWCSSNGKLADKQVITNDHLALDRKEPHQ